MAKVTVFTKNGCPQCEMTKNVLKGEGIEFELRNVEEIDPLTGEKTKKAQEAFDYVVEVLGLRQMPVVEVEGQEPFAGFRPDKLQELKK